VEPGAAKPFPLGSYLPETLTQLGIIVFLRLIMVYRGRDIDQQAGLSFAEPKTFPGMGYRQAFGPGL